MSSAAGGDPNEASGAVAVDSTSVYWTDPAVGAVMKVPIGGGAPTTLASGPDFGEGSPYGGFSIVLDATSVYWLNAGELADGGGDGFVVKVPLDGGTATTFLSGQGLYGDIAVDATSVYFATTVCPNDGGNCECDGGSCPTAFLKMPIDGGAPTTLASIGPSFPLEFAVDDTSLYWTDCGSCTGAVPGGDGLVMKVPLAGGSPTTLASGQRGPGAIAVDATSVYWTAYDGLMKLTPK